MRVNYVFSVASLLLLASSLISDAAAQKPVAATNQDENGNVQYTFNDEAGIKVAPSKSEAANSSCLSDKDSGGIVVNEGAIRYNKAIKSLEYCNGAQWVSSQTSSLPIARYSYNKPPQTTTVLEGMFVNDGYVAGLVACNGGGLNQRLRVHLLLWDQLTSQWRWTVGATAQDSPGGSYEIDHSSFFSVVPAKVPWRVYITSNYSQSGDNTANCSLDVTKIGS